MKHLQPTHISRLKLFFAVRIFLFSIFLFGIETAQAQSPFGNALNFNGGNYVSIANFGNIIPTNEITVEFWANTTIPAGLSAFMLNPDQSTNRFNIHLNYGGPLPDEGVTYWDFGNILTGGRLGPVNAPANSVTNWVHYAFVASQKGNYMAIYTNGVLCASKPGMTPFARGNYELRIGYPYAGRLDDFRVWNVVRSQAQILANMNAPLAGDEPNLIVYYRFDDASGNIAINSAIATGATYNGTLINSPVWTNADEPIANFQNTNPVAYTFSTLAGSSASGSSDGIGDAARFANPHGIATDTNGNIYVADFNNDTIRKITPAGIVTTVAGLAGSSGSADGDSTAARFNHPFGVAVDNSGNIFVADSDNDTIREITPAGVVSTIAGLAGDYGYADGTNGAAQFSYPFGIAIDNQDNLYVADAYNFLIRKIMPVGTNWVVSTLAGKPGILGDVDGTGTNALFNFPYALTVDADGNVYVCDSQPSIREITSAGVVTTIAGGMTGAADGVGTNAEFYSPFGIAVDRFTNLYVADGNASTVRKIVSVGTNWVVTTFAGFPMALGSIDGTGTNAEFGQTWGVAVDNFGNVYVSDKFNNNIRKITSAGVVSTLAGTENSSSYLDGTGLNARFNAPSGVTLDGSGNIYIADQYNQVIRKITPVGVVSTLAGRAGVAGEQDGIGNQALFNHPFGIVADQSGNVYVTDNSSGAIREVTPAGIVTTIAGSSGAGYQDGPVVTAKFNNPAGIAIDSSDNLYIAEQAYNLIRMIATNGIVSTVAGFPPLYNNGIPLDNNGIVNHVGSYADGTGTNARFNLPSGIAADNQGNLYVADSDNYVVRKIYAPATGKNNPANWMVTTLAGTPGVGGSADGTGANASFGSYFYFPGPTGIAVDNSGNVFVTDNDNSTLRKITPAGVVTTLAGQAGVVGNADGPSDNTRFDVPTAIALDSLGSIYVVDQGNSALGADQGNNTIRKGIFSAYGAANQTTYVAPVMNGSLQVVLLPPQANGQWRFPWELGWHNSGDIVSNLAADNYSIEFRSVPGWVVVQTNFIVSVATNMTTSVTNQYYPTISDGGTGGNGSLTVNIGPNLLSNSGWRFLGESNWRAAGSMATNLLPDVYLIEFEPVSGYTKPASESVQVFANSPTIISANYLLAQSAPANVLLPFPVPANEISDEANYPFGFNGQLQSDVGYGSGVAVQSNVVLTAAHLVFNDQTLSYVNQVYWYFRQENGVNAPEPQPAQCWYVLSGYASARTNALQSGLYGPDQSTPQSRNVDVAALYFSKPMAGDGYGGYLPSDQTPNQWLTGDSLKMVVGYPVDGSMFGDASIVPGMMYQTAPQPYTFTPATDPVDDEQVYVAPWILSYPGNSGGPVYAQFNGYYYPAAVYLGIMYNGSVPYASLVRAIDGDVVDLITNAQALDISNTNTSGGGVITIVPNQAINASHPAYLEFQLTPPAAVAAGAGWKLQGDSTYSSATNYVRAVTTTNAIVVQFKPINGWNVPGNQVITLIQDQITPYNAFYTVSNPMLTVDRTSGLGIIGTTGTTYQIQSSASLSSGSWTPISTNTITSTGFNLVLPLSATNTTFFRALWLP